MTINQRFKTLRERLRVSQNEMAQKIGTDQASISKIENGKLNLTLENIQNLHTHYAINLNWLISGSGKMNENLSENVVGESETNYLKNKDSDLLQKVIDAQDKTIKTYEDRIRELTEKVNELKSSHKNQTYTK